MTILTSAANKKVTVGNTSTLILSQNSARKLATIINNSDEDITLSIGAAAVAGEGVLIKAAGFGYEINIDNLLTGAVYGICASGGKSVAVMEATE